MEMEPIIKLNVNWSERTDAHKQAVDALTALVPVFNMWADFIPQEAYGYKGDAGETDRLNARYWAPMRSSGEYSAVENALADYMRYTFANPKNAGTVAFIMANDPSVSQMDLYNHCVEHVLGKLPQILRNVSNTFASKKGEVNKSEGCLLYINRTVFSHLIDLARRIDSGYGRNEKKPADLFETEGRPIRSAEELAVGTAVIRRGNRVGTCLGTGFSGGTEIVRFRFDDGCEESIPSQIIPARIRIFTGNKQDIPAQAEEEKKTGSRHLSLDELIGDSDEEGIALINLLPCGKSGEECLLDNELYSIVRRTYLTTLRSLRGDFVRSYMLALYVHDSLCMDFTHTDEVIRQLDTRDHMSLFREIHERNCAIMDMTSEDSAMTPNCDPEGTSYTVKQLTVAKHYAKRLLRANMSVALAA